MAEQYQLPTPPRSSVDPRSPGLRTYDQHVGGSKPITIDNQGNYIYSPRIYLVFAVLVIGIVIVALVLKHMRTAGGGQ
jgi:hypothetical protein